MARSAPTLVRKSGSPERPYRSRSDFKTNRKALPPLHANVSMHNCFHGVLECLEKDWELWEDRIKLDGRTCSRMKDWEGALLLGRNANAPLL